MLVESWLISSVKDRESALISRRYGVHRPFLQLLYWNLCSSRLEMGVSGNLWISLKDVKPLGVYDVEREMAMEPMQGKYASSWVDLGYSNLFCIPEVTALFFLSCERVLGNSLEFHQGNRGSLCVWLEHGIPLHAVLGNRASSSVEGEVSWVFSSCVRHLGFILELQQGWASETRICSAKSGLLSS